MRSRTLHTRLPLTYLVLRSASGHTPWDRVAADATKAGRQRQPARIQPPSRPHRAQDDRAEPHHVSDAAHGFGGTRACGRRLGMGHRPILWIIRRRHAYCRLVGGRKTGSSWYVQSSLHIRRILYRDLTANERTGQRRIRVRR